jgi:hypothetical protein
MVSLLIGFDVVVHSLSESPANNSALVDDEGMI